jgi:addiction module HigA family antidote
MPRTTQSPSEILQKYIDDYQTNPFALSKSLGVAYQTVTFILKEKSKISPQMALRLAKHYGNTPEYWLDIQAQADIAELSADKKFTSQLNKIHKAVKNTGKAKTPKKGTDKTAKPAKKAAKAKSKKKVKAFKTSRKTKK